MNRKFVIIGAVVVVVLVIAIAVPCALLLGKKDELTSMERAQQLLDETPLVDGLSENLSNGDEPCRSLWVGNINPEEVSERQLLQLFSRCGRVDNVRILPKRFCAFVKYEKSESAAIALEKLQAYELGGKTILLRYPNNTGSPGSQAVHPNINPVTPVKKKPQDGDVKSMSQKLSGPVNGDECYFWRTTGCYFAEKCRFRHVPENKGVDLKRVEAKYGGKLRVTPPSENNR